MSEAIEKIEIGTLELGEVHPAAHEAFKYVKDYLFKMTKKNLSGIFMLQEAFASCGIEGNRLAEVCGETLRRIVNGEGVSDRYLLGLAWTLKSMQERKVKR